MNLGHPLGQLQAGIFAPNPLTQLGARANVYTNASIATANDFYRPCIHPDCPICRKQREQNFKRQVAKEKAYKKRCKEYMKRFRAGYKKR